MSAPAKPTLAPAPQKGAPASAAYRVATLVCRDTRDGDATVDYPMWGGIGPDERRLISWQLAFTLMSSAARTHGAHERVVYTNDEAPPRLAGRPVEERLAAFGARVEYLPFENYRLPEGLSVRYTNAFYRFEVIEALSRLAGPSLVLDADTLLVGGAGQLAHHLASPGLLAYDVYDRGGRPYAPRPHGISMADMGATFRHIDPAYPHEHPVWYGHEALAGHPADLAALANRVGQIMGRYAYYYERGLPPPLFANGAEFFSSDEFVLSFACGELNPRRMNPFVKRLFALSYLDNTAPGDLSIPIWHLPAEKATGLMMLAAHALDESGPFWETPLDQFAAWAGGYVGVPRRQHHPAETATGSAFVGLIRTLKGHLGMAMRNL